MVWPVMKAASLLAMMMRPPPAARIWGTQAQQQRNTPSVLTYHPAPLAGVDFLERTQLERAEDRGVVHQDVDAAERFHGFGRHLLDIAFKRNIYFQAQRLRTGRLGDLGSRDVVIAKIGDDDGRAVFREAHRQRLADAAARAGDDGDFPTEFHGFHTTFSYSTGPERRPISCANRFIALAVFLEMV